MAPTAGIVSASPALSNDEIKILVEEIAQAGLSFKACRLWLQLMQRTRYGKVIANKSGEKPVSFTIEECVLVPD